jgi:hypothetical protein
MRKMEYPASSIRWVSWAVFGIGFLRHGGAYPESLGLSGNPHYETRIHFLGIFRDRVYNSDSKSTLTGWLFGHTDYSRRQ